MASSFKKRKDKKSHRDGIQSPLESTCSSCGGVLTIPLVQCAVCQPQVFICKSCFAMGAEFSNHENDHPYSIVKYNFSIFDSKWTAVEELKLLDAIIENGFGNWPAISIRVRTKTAAECENHYMRCYVEFPQDPLPKFPDDVIADGGAPMIFKLCDNPPRPADGSTLSLEMGGYSASRGDFNVEFNNFAEMDICRMKLSESDLEDDDDDNDDSKPEDVVDEDGCVTERLTLSREERQEQKIQKKQFYEDVHFGVLQIYRNCLRERQWRKNLVRKYGLINIRRWYALCKRRYESSISFEFFRPFMRFFSAYDFDKCLESLYYEKQLKSEIKKLQEYRKNGIKRLSSIRTFYLLRQRRDGMKSKRHLLQDVLNHIKDEASAQTWLARQAAIDGSGASSKNFPPLRKPSQRLNIDNLPDLDKLSHEERELCAEVRLVPKAYLDFSKILINECRKNGSLRLAQARTLIKIDVNKTRKLYDFLILHGYINKDPI